MFWGYNNLARELGPDQPVYGFKSRGLEGLAEFTNIEEIAAQYVSDLLKFQPNGPYYLGGYCFGGNVAYEMARQLRAQNHEVALLLLVNCWANNSSYTRVTLTPKFVLKAATNFVVRLEHQVRRGIQNPRDFFKWRAAWVVRRVKALLASNVEDRLSVEDIVNMSTQSEEERKLWRTHVQAWLKYRPEPYQGEVVLFRTRGHPLVCSFDHKMGWGDLASGGVTVRVCPGDHESILEEENVGRVARELKDILENLRTETRPQCGNNESTARATAFTQSPSLTRLPSATSTI
jgi:thioesterase domain-containing protein